jgi:hypothetical protein
VPGYGGLFAAARVRLAVGEVAWPFVGFVASVSTELDEVSAERRRAQGPMLQTFRIGTKAKDNPRFLRLRFQAQHETLQARRERQETAEFKERYKRAGVEGAISQGARAFDLRRSRYIGLAKTHLHHVATAAAINLTQAAAWLAGMPKAQTRQSRFAALTPSA